MASMLSDVEPLVRRVKAPGMVNKLLQNICVAEGLNKTGVKAELQSRLIERIKDHHTRRDIAAFNRLKTMLENPSTIPQPGASFGSATASPSAPGPAPASYSGGYHPGVMNSAYRGAGYNSLDFKPSPFYAIQQQLGETKTLEVMANHRHSATIPIRVSDHPILVRVNLDPSLRVMVFCAADNHGRQDIAFPHQSEIKVNGGEVKANLRGLKNKPGSTRPVDITKELRLKIPQYSNNVELTYALTNKKFYLLIYVVKTVPVADLVKKLETGRRITKETIVSDMVNKARDADIVATASVLSLKCPLSTLRIDLPCRSIACRHNQCFDATSYLQLQEQGPTWLCPICNNPAPFDSLAVDEYVRDILKNTSKSVDQVTIQPDGKWELHVRPEPTSKTNGVASSDDDDDLVEITKTGDSIRMSTPRIFGTPVAGALPSTREASSSSVAPRSQGSTSGKRPIAAVIDLTSSGDEDDEPIARQPKRQYINSTTNGFVASSVPVYRPGTGTSNGYPSRP